MGRVEAGKCCSIRLMLEDAEGMPDMEQFAHLGKLSLDAADGAQCTTLSFNWGGERA